LNCLNLPVSLAFRARSFLSQTAAVADRPVSRQFLRPWALIAITSRSRPSKCRQLAWDRDFAIARVAQSLILNLSLRSRNSGGVIALLNKVAHPTSQTNFLNGIRARLESCWGWVAVNRPRSGGSVRQPTITAPLKPVPGVLTSSDQGHFLHAIEGQDRVQPKARPERTTVGRTIRAPSRSVPRQPCKEAGGPKRHCPPPRCSSSGTCGGARRQPADLGYPAALEPGAKQCNPGHVADFEREKVAKGLDRGGVDLGAFWEGAREVDCQCKRAREGRESGRGRRQRLSRAHAPA
jgi:hypothetical protein